MSYTDVTKVQMNRISAPGLSVHQTHTFLLLLSPWRSSPPSPHWSTSLLHCALLWMFAAFHSLLCLYCCTCLPLMHMHVFCFASTDIHPSSLQCIPPPVRLSSLSLHIIMLSENIIVQANSHLPRLWICPSPVQGRRGSESPRCHFNPALIRLSLLHTWLILTMSSFLSHWLLCTPDIGSVPLIYYSTPNVLWITTSLILAVMVRLKAPGNDSLYNKYLYSCDPWWLAGPCFKILSDLFYRIFPPPPSSGCISSLYELNMCLYLCVVQVELLICCLCVWVSSTYVSHPFCYGS